MPGRSLVRLNPLYRAVLAYLVVVPSLLLHHTRETTISSPRMFTEYVRSGLGGGPAIFLPFKSNVPPWHAQTISLSPESYWTVQLR